MLIKSLENEVYEISCFIAKLKLNMLCCSKNIRTVVNYNCK